MIRKISNKTKKVFSGQHYPINCEYLLLVNLFKQYQHVLLNQYKKKNKRDPRVEVQCTEQLTWQLKIQ